MKPGSTKATLSPSRKRLIELMQSINFGRIENLTLHRGDPVLEPPPCLIREVKFGGENGPRPERDASDFLLKTQVIELFAYFAQLGDGVIDRIEVKHGLPFRLQHTEPAA